MLTMLCHDYDLLTPLVRLRDAWRLAEAERFDAASSLMRIKTATRRATELSTRPMIADGWAFDKIAIDDYGGRASYLRLWLTHF